MIFHGKISEKCKKYIAWRESITAFIGSLIAVLLLTIPLIFLAIYVDYRCLYMLIILVLFVCLASVPPKNEALEKIIPQKISVIGDKIISEGTTFYIERELIEVKKVIDYGEWYQLIFYFGYKTVRFVCQKDLLVEGTTNEFEKLFEGKIIKNKI